MAPLAHICLALGARSGGGVGARFLLASVGTFPDAVVYVLIGLVAVLSVAVAILGLKRRRKNVRKVRRNASAREQKSDRVAAAGEIRPTGRVGVTNEPNQGMGANMVTEAPIDANMRLGKLHSQGTRDQQQDSFGVSDESMVMTHGQLVVVCDGMGGLANGGEVSSKAVETILDKFLLMPHGADPLQILESLTVEANQAVNAMLGPAGIKACGSTLVMALLRDGLLSFLSIGDSRISLFRDGELMQLNREHVYETELVRKAVNGEMSLSDAFADKQGKGLVSYLGMGHIEAIDVPASPLKLHLGDMVVLMTDGVYNALTDEEISAALSLFDPNEAAEVLGRSIEEKGYESQDNYTAVVVAI